MTSASPITSNDGKFTPQLDLGVWQMIDDEATAAVSHALETGYRHVDTVAIYRNEMGVGRAIAAFSLPCDKIPVTTRLWSKDQGRNLACPGLEQNFEKPGLDHVDLYPIRWPCPARGTYVETWEQLVDSRSGGLVRSTGVCNSLPEYLDIIVDETGITPVMDQTELRPTFQPDDPVNHCSGLRITVGSQSPLGRVADLGHPVTTRIAEQLGAAPAQVIICWRLDRGFVVIPKSKTPTRIESNFAALEMKLSAEDRAAIDAFSTGNRIGLDLITLEMV